MINLTIKAYSEILPNPYKITLAFQTPMPPPLMTVKFKKKYVCVARKKTTVRKGYFLIFRCVSKLISKFKKISAVDIKKYYNQNYAHYSNHFLVIFILSYFTPSFSTQTTEKQ